MSLRLFHFMSSHHALNSLEEQALKVSNFEDLNDPFELLAAGSGEKDTRTFLEIQRRAMSNSIRMICCCKAWENPVVWGHYADSHRGIALALEVDGLVKDVKYVADRTIFGDIRTDQGLSEINKIDLLSTKYEGCLLYTSPSPRDLSTSRMPSSA